MWMYATAVLVLAADLATKAAMLEFLTMQPNGRYPLVPGLLDLYLQFNPGGAFSVFHTRPLFITAFALVATGALLWWGHRLQPDAHAAKIALGLILGGALGNLVDRIRYGAVVDFIHFYWHEWYWPTFNLADTAICVGVGLVVILSLFSDELASARSSMALPGSSESTQRAQPEVPLPRPTKSPVERPVPSASTDDGDETVGGSANLHSPSTSAPASNGDVSRG